jgi:hypothetical protein
LCLWTPSAQIPRNLVDSFFLLHLFKCPLFNGRYLHFRILKFPLVGYPVTGYPVTGWSLSPPELPPAFALGCPAWKYGPGVVVLLVTRKLTKNY